MFAPALQQQWHDWPRDLARHLRNCTLSCVVSGVLSKEIDPGPPPINETITYSGDASEDFVRNGYHLGAVAAGKFNIAEEVGIRSLLFLSSSAGGLSINVLIEEDGTETSNTDPVAEVGCGIENESLTALAGPFTVAFALTLDSQPGVALASVPGLTRADILAGVTDSGTITLSGYSGSITVDYELSFSV